MLWSDLCNFSQLYMVVKREITVKGNNGKNWQDKKLTCKNNAPFRSCISKIDNLLMNNVDIYIFMPMCKIVRVQ